MDDIASIKIFGETVEEETKRLTDELHELDTMILKSKYMPDKSVFDKRDKLRSLLFSVEQRRTISYNNPLL